VTFHYDDKSDRAKGNFGHKIINRALTLKCHLLAFSFGSGVTTMINFWSIIYIRIEIAVRRRHWMKALLRIFFLILTFLTALATPFSIGAILFVHGIEIQSLMLLVSLICFILWGVCNYALNLLRDRY
jgi:hypothetical protein